MCRAQRFSKVYWVNLPKYYFEDNKDIFNLKLICQFTSTHNWLGSLSDFFYCVELIVVTVEEVIVYS